MIHLLKIYAWPSSQAALHWRSEAAGFLTDARRSFSPSMRQKIDLADIYGDAVYRMSNTAGDAGAGRLFPNTCPFTLDELLAPRTDVAALVAKIGSL